MYISTPTNSPKRCKKEWKQEIFFHCSFNENKPKPISKPYLYCISVKCIHKQGRQNFIAIERSLSLSPDKSYIKSTEITTKRQVYNINSFKTELCEYSFSSAAEITRAISTWYFAGSYLRFSACYVDENNTIRFSEKFPIDTYNKMSTL